MSLDMDTSVATLGVHYAHHPALCYLFEVDRGEFEVLRDIPGKIISVDIKFSRKLVTLPALTADSIPIENTCGTELRLNIHFNPESGAKSFNVHVLGIGPICRLDVDGPAHRPAGRSHKHSVQNDRCPERNLPDGVIDRKDLSGKSLRDVFDAFCEMSHISHKGSFEAPEDS